MNENWLVHAAEHWVPQTKVNIANDGQNVHLDWQTHCSKSNLGTKVRGVGFVGNLSQKHDYGVNSVLVYQPCIILDGGVSASSFGS